MIKSKLWWWIGGLALAFVLAGVPFPRFAPPDRPPVALPEAAANTLILREGKLYSPGQTNAFTGVLVETYPSGEPKSRSHVVDGLLHGLSQGWHTNGTLQVSESFVAGVSHGTRTKWHANGQLLSEVTISNGLLHGVFRRWTEQGDLSEEVSMAHGQPDGLSRSFYPSGCIKAEAQLRAGQLVENRFYNDGDRPHLASAE